METIGEKIRKLRKIKGITQDDLAEELRVARQTVSNWEVDLKIPATENLIALSKYFNVSMDYLVPKKSQEIEVAVADSTTELKPASEAIQDRVPAEIENKQRGKKLARNKPLFITLIVFASLIFVISAVVGAIILYFIVNPLGGIKVMQSHEYDWIGIVCGSFAIISLVGLITLMFFRVKNKKEKIQLSVSEMQSEDGRQDKNNEL